MISDIRARLRAIRYYSASRHDTPWHRASDAALWIALVLAMPANWLATWTVRSPGNPLVVQGRLGETAAGEPASWLADPVLDAQPPGRLLGTFQLELVEQEQGWPFVTRVGPRPPTLALDIFREVQPRANVRLPRDDPMRAAIAGALERGGASRMHAAWVGEDLPVRTVWVGWIVGTLVWWVILSAAGTFAVWTAAYLWRLGRARHARRQRGREASGRCAVCGYDLRGLEFNERCPECGART